MRPKIFLRLAAILMLLHDIGHSFGALTWKISDDPAKRELINQMTVRKFPFMGVERSFGDYFDGYGYAMVLALLLIALILWIVSDFTMQYPILIKKMLIVISIILLGMGVNELIFFFPLAAFFSLLASLLTFIALFNLNKSPG